MSRRAVLYCQGKDHSAAAEALRQVGYRERWSIIGTFAEESKRPGPEYERLWRRIEAGEADLLAVPSFGVLASGISGVLSKILRLRGAGCDLYVHDIRLNTASPVDRTLFPIAEALSALGDEGTKRRDLSTARAAQLSKRPRLTTPGQRSLIRAALSAGLTPRAVAKSLKLPLAMVQTIAKGEER